MTEKEMAKIDYEKKCKRPSGTPRMAKKYKLKMRYGEDWSSLTREIIKTQEKLGLLLELRMEHIVKHG